MKESDKTHIKSIVNAFDEIYTLRRYTGKAPCPVCDRKVDRKGKDKPCRHCRSLIEYAIESKKRGVELSGEYVYVQVPTYNLHAWFSLPSELQEEYGAFRTGKLPYWSDDKGNPDYNSRALLQPFAEWLNSMHVDNVPSEKVLGCVSYDGTSSGSVTLRKESAIAMLRFYDFLSEMMTVTNKRSKEEGQNILQGLINKDITMGV